MSTALYRFYDADGALLYVGITNNLPARIGEHAREKTWAACVATVRVEQYANRADAIEAERVAISTEHPAHNVVHNGGRHIAVVNASPDRRLECPHAWVEPDTWGRLACCDCDVVLYGPLAGRPVAAWAI